MTRFEFFYEVDHSFMTDQVLTPTTVGMSAARKAQRAEICVAHVCASHVQHLMCACVSQHICREVWSSLLYSAGISTRMLLSCAAASGLNRVAAQGVVYTM